jgi:hypothetical protein
MSICDIEDAIEFLVGHTPPLMESLIHSMLKILQDGLLHTQRGRWQSSSYLVSIQKPLAFCGSEVFDPSYLLISLSFPSPPTQARLQDGRR